MVCGPPQRGLGVEVGSGLAIKVSSKIPGMGEGGASVGEGEDESGVKIGSSNSGPRGSFQFLNTNKYAARLTPKSKTTPTTMQTGFRLSRVIVILIMALR